MASPNGKYALLMQDDGNLVLWDYTVNPPYPRWCTHTTAPGAYAAMQTDGNLVMYAGGANGGSAIWASNTRYVGTDNVIMQSDGNLVVRAGTVPACATGTWGSYGYLRVQSDGNLVVYNSANQAVWARSWGSTCH